MYIYQTEKVENLKGANFFLAGFLSLTFSITAIAKLQANSLMLE